MTQNTYNNIQDAIKSGYFNGNMKVQGRKINDIKVGEVLVRGDITGCFFDILPTSAIPLPPPNAGGSS